MVDDLNQPVTAPWHARLGLRARFTLLFHLVTLLAVGGVGYYGYTSAADAQRAKAVETVQGYTRQVSQKISDFMDLTHNDLNWFANHPNLRRHLYWSDLQDAKKQDYWKVQTMEAWQAFTSNYDYLYKVRFLDQNGLERIALRRDPGSRQVRVLADHELQDQSREPFFQKARQLGREEYFVSPLDLSREQGRIERPLVPVVRLSRPVIGGNGVNYGVAVMNLFAGEFLEHLREANQRIQAGGFYLLDARGEFLYHPEEEQRFGHLLGHAWNFRTRYPGVLEQIGEREEGTLFTHGRIITFKRIHPQPGNPDYHWIVAGVMDEAAVLAELQEFKNLFAGLMLLMLALVLLVSHSYVGGIMRPLLFVTRQLERLGRGEVTGEGISYRHRDEIRQMLDSTTRLLANMESLAGQADAIARGDFSREVTLLSDRDRLGLALNNMTAMLRTSRQESERQLWLKEGIGRLSQALTGDLTPQGLAEQALAIIARHLEAGRGVFYLYHPEDRVLELLGSFMFTQRPHGANQVRLGEGAVGQAARERKPIILTLPPGEEAPHVATGTAVAAAPVTCTWPLVREGELLGVLEVNGFTPLDGLRQEFLEGAAEVVSSFLFMALQRQRIGELFTAAEESKRQAQEQAGRLEQINARMEQQQHRLQQQTEELQQTNAQMEEQQQQLQQQTEELQQTNAQMEEQQQQLQQQAAELQRSNEALIRSRGDLDQRARQLEESNRYKSEFLANMSHELRTPLNSIIVLSKMLHANEKGDLDAESIKQARVINDAGNELLRLINDILDLSKIEAGRVELHWESCSTSQLLGEFRELFEATAGEKGLEFVVDDQFGGQLTTDRHKLAQVVRNLLANAFKFTRAGRVELVLRQDPQSPAHLLIQVHDTGIGIPADKHRLIFEEFQQVDGSISREYGGTGLGLSICRRLMEMLGGSIGLSSVEGEGSTFTLRLPIRSHPPTTSGSVQTLPSEREATLEPAPPADRFEDDRGRLSPGERPILVIDDDPTFCETVILLNRRLGHRTVAALSGAEGLAMAREMNPLGIVLDLGLPDRDGLEVLNRLKTTRELNPIPVYIVTGKEKEVKWEERGAAGFLQKPVSAEALSRMMDAFHPPDGGPPRVLLVAGEGGGESRRTTLEALAGVEVTRVGDADAAVAALKGAGETPYSVVVSEYHLPDGSRCPELCARLRQITPGLSFIVLTDTPLSDEEELALRNYTDTVIQQGAQGEHRLLSGVERFLRAIRTPSPPNVPGALPVGATEATLGGRVILVVDDDPRNLYVITAALERQGARVEQAMNGRKALALLEREPVDLVLMDIMMPELSGYHAIEAIRADERLKGLPIIALTAKAMQEDREKCLAVGANDYLAKPVDYHVLVNMVRAWIEQRP